MIALDIESSGPKPETGSILSIGAVDTDNPTNQFYGECHIWDDAIISEKALEINGFSREEATDPTKKSEAELVAAFIAWATDGPQNRTLVAQNVSFDRDFVKHACLRAGIEFPFAERAIDIHSITWLHMTLHGREASTHNKHSLLSLDESLKYCGIPYEPKPHNALTGAQSHAEVFARIAYTKNILPEFSEYPIPWK